MTLGGLIRASADKFRIAVAVFILAAAPARAADPKYGILLLAHGGQPEWDAEISKIAAALRKQAPTEVALGMADTDATQKAIDALAAKKVRKIVAVPLFINSNSEVMDQTRFILGVNEKPSLILKEALSHIPHIMMPLGHHHMYSETRVVTALPLVITSALDDAPQVSEILLERAKALSKEPKKEAVILVGHGPVDDKADAQWVAIMKTLAKRLKKSGGFARVDETTVRDDSPLDVKAKAAAGLRGLVEKAAKDGLRPVVLPYLIARGGIESHITEDLKGLDYAWDDRPLCPHPAIARWAAEVAAKGANLDNMRRFK